MELLIGGLLNVAGSILPSILNKPPKTGPLSREGKLLLNQPQDPTPGYIILGMLILIILLILGVVLKKTKS